jgi:DNA (cytosine-5)-methyltransferase 1
MRRTPHHAVSNHRDPLPAISLFSGAGGLDLGLASASGGRISFRAWVERDADSRNTICTNQDRLGEAGPIYQDIRSVEPSAVLDETRLSAGDAFLVAGGPPCQAFSTAGLRASVNETRGQVVDNYLRFIKTAQPRFFVFENVRGLLSVALQHRNYRDRIETERQSGSRTVTDPSQRLGSVFDDWLLPRFKRLGYEVIYGLVNAADYGTAQVRWRLVVLGSRDNEFGAGQYRKETGQLLEPAHLMPPTHHRHAPYPPLRPWRTLDDAIGHLAAKPPSSDETVTYSEERKAVWRRMPPGVYWTYVRDNPELFPPRFLEQIMGGAINSGGGKVGFWRRLSWDRPSPTLPTQPQHLATGLCHPEEERPLSVPEYAAIQDFPPGYAFCGRKDSQYRQIGNAVPVRLAQALGETLLAFDREKIGKSPSTAMLRAVA